MAKEKVLNEKMDINTPFKDFVRKFKKQKTAIVAMCFIIALAWERGTVMAKEKVLNEKMDINTPFKDFVRKFKKQKTAIVAMCFIIALAVMAVVSYQIAPYGINEYDYTAIMQGPSAAHWFGTDEFGRDLFSRIICGTRISLSVGLFSVSIAAVCGTILGLLGGYHWFGTDEFGRDLFSRIICGTRISLSVGLFSVSIAAVCGTILGLLGGYYGGILDSIIMRICDTLFAFPGIILAIAIIAILGSGMTNVVIAVAVFSTPTFARLVRSTTLATKGNVFVQAAKNLGASDARILFRHILPSAIPNIIVQYTMSIGTSILTASSLSFLGMGAQPPTPEWGLLLSNGRTYMATSWHITLFPGLAIFLTVLCFNLLGDGLRDALDPKLTD